MPLSIIAAQDGERRDDFELLYFAKHRFPKNTLWVVEYEGKQATNFEGLAYVCKVSDSVHLFSYLFI